jgi:hypothetical protein
VPSRALHRGARYITDAIGWRPGFPCSDASPRVREADAAMLRFFWALAVLSVLLGAGPDRGGDRSARALSDRRGEKALGAPASTTMRARTPAHWMITGLLVFAMFRGGVAFHCTGKQGRGSSGKNAAGLVPIVQDLSETMTPTSSFERLHGICSDVGFDLERIHPSILARMRLLTETTETVNDCERAVRIANAVFRYYDVSKPLKRFTALERRIVVIGTLFSDVGKSGPAGASLDGQQLVAEMFAVENAIDERTSVARFFEVYFPADAAQRARRFAALGLNAGMTMREFWNLHSAWTLHILQGDGVPAEAVPAAATHHMLENVNPDSLVANDGRFTKYFGKHASFERPEKLVILLDKYDAARRRGHCTHDQSIAFLRDVIGRNHRFCGDPGFLELIEDLAEVMKVPNLSTAEGLPPGKAEELFQPFEQRSSDRTGVQ